MDSAEFRVRPKPFSTLAAPPPADSSLTPDARQHDGPKHPTFAHQQRNNPTPLGSPTPPTAVSARVRVGLEVGAVNRASAREGRDAVGGSCPRCSKTLPQRRRRRRARGLPPTRRLSARRWLEVPAPAEASRLLHRPSRGRSLQPRDEPTSRDGRGAVRRAVVCRRGQPTELRNGHVGRPAPARSRAPALAAAGCRGVQPDPTAGRRCRAPRALHQGRGDAGTVGSGWIWESAKRDADEALARPAATQTGP